MLLLEKSTYYSVHQSETKRLFHVDFGQKVVKLNFCQMLALREKVNAIQLDLLFDSEVNKHGLHMLTLCNNEHLFVLSIEQVIDLVRLVHNSFAAMGLSQKYVPVSL
ncbi:hypothetical protein GCM10011414_02580 [Croceivirga lutea]|uniref:hypothetical protein n=1 Tax=Croceivirga lutea TaxID=1775167 RepID=UPI00163ADD47|nr:hypothetical protein [Croceivirga lutea]GGG36709.1 hypothetical protein GCM10011414_02580 [Croceivirga lutea]